MFTIFDNTNDLMVKKINQQLLLSPSVKNAMLNIDRAHFLPNGFGDKYSCESLPISAGQWISSPLTVAEMTMLLKLDNCDKVLEIGCGSGYQAAVLSQLCRCVFTIERVKELIITAKENFKKANINNIHLCFDDGQRGWGAWAPYERILFSACARKIPAVLFNQLEDGGILLAPMLLQGVEKLVRFTKIQQKVEKEILHHCSFVPVLDGLVR